MLIRVVFRNVRFSGKGVGGVQKRLKAIFDDAASHQPSIVFLDNLDHLISAPTSGMAETAGDALYSTKLAQSKSSKRKGLGKKYLFICLALCDLVINELHRGSVIALIATSRSRDSLHPTLMPRRGQHVFKKVLELKAPNKVCWIESKICVLLPGRNSRLDGRTFSRQ